MQDPTAPEARPARTGSACVRPPAWAVARRRARRAALGALTAAATLLPAAPAAVAQEPRIPVHDPVMIQAGDRYYLFTTGRGISVWSSSDRETWQEEPQVFEAAPSWAEQVAPRFRNHIWAPDIYEHQGRYYLYYSVSAFGRNTSAIGVASNATLDRTDPAFEWVDHGIVVQSVPGRDMWNAIDPAVIHDEGGTPWMTFGSFWSGLKLVQLSDDLTAVAQPEEWHTLAARHRSWKLDERDAGDAMNGAIEAPFLFRRNGYYYLFASWDRCCSGLESTYKVVVGRSRDITGPYLDRVGEDMRLGGGSLVVAGNDDWAGVGHNSAYTFDGRDYLVFHGYDVSDEGRSKLLVREIQWDADGWPTVTLP